MSNYLSKLRPGSYEQRWLINNVSIGLKEALEDEDVINNHETKRLLQTYKDVVNSFPVGYWRNEDVDEAHIKVTLFIQKEAYDLVRNL